MPKKEEESSSSQQFVKWFSEITDKDFQEAGGKGVNLAEMYLYKLPIPQGFVVTAQAYEYFIEKAFIKEKIPQILAGISPEDTRALFDASKKIRSLFKNSEVPSELKDAILESYDILDVDKQQYSLAKESALAILKNSREPPFVAVRSSPTSKDFASASYAGQHESFLNIKGRAALIEKYKDCISSLFTPRSIFYMLKKGISPADSSLGVVIQTMVDAEKSGVMFTNNPTGLNENIIIEAIWGLGEGIVSGLIKPDHYEVDKNLDEFKLLSSDIAEKKLAVARNSSGKNEIIKLSPERAKHTVLSNYELKVLSNYGGKLQEYYHLPQSVEFCIIGENIMLIQSSPIVTQTQELEKLKLSLPLLLSGLGASPGIASGVVSIINNEDDLGKVKQGDVFVASMIVPDMVVSLQKASGIITDEGGMTSNTSAVSREMGIPCVVGTSDATRMLKDGQVVTIDGLAGKIYDGKSNHSSNGAISEVPDVQEVPEMPKEPAPVESPAQPVIIPVSIPPEIPPVMKQPIIIPEMENLVDGIIPNPNSPDRGFGTKDDITIQILSNRDMQDVILQELEAHDEDVHNHYIPGDSNSKQDIPPLNDAIPADSKAVERSAHSDKVPREVEVK